jgi:hypothetical protein
MFFEIQQSLGLHCNIKRTMMTLVINCRLIMLKNIRIHTAHINGGNERSGGGGGKCFHYSPSL